MSMIIPGVSVQVVSEIVPSSLLQTGVLGIVGCTETADAGGQLQAYGSVTEVCKAYGVGTLAAMPELKQAFGAGLSKAVVVPVGGSTAVPASAKIPLAGDKAMAVHARAAGAWGNTLAVRVIQKNAGPEPIVDVEVFRNYQKDAANTPIEAFRNLFQSDQDPNLKDKNNNPRARDPFWATVTESSQYITLTPPQGEPHAAYLPTDPSPVALAGGTDATPTEFEAALANLEPLEIVDMVVTSHQLGPDNSRQVNAYVLAHCQKMAKAGYPRIGFGQVATPFDGGNVDVITNESVMGASLVNSERFVFATPNGYVGALIGTVAAMNYWESPTFKPIAGVSALPFDYTNSQLEQLILGNVCATDYVPHRGIVCVKGILTNGQPINVTRVADFAVRRIKMASEPFIGQLNNEAQRLALKQAISGALTEMERDGAIVPSTDGKSPAFMVSVVSTQDDFKQGRVMVQAAIRPVRSIDYIYATLFVQAS